MEWAWSDNMTKSQPRYPIKCDICCVLDHMRDCPWNDDPNGDDRGYDLIAQ